jgi:hypothetical protein
METYSFPLLPPPPLHHIQSCSSYRTSQKEREKGKRERILSDEDKNGAVVIKKLLYLGKDLVKGTLVSRPYQDKTVLPLTILLPLP